MGNKKNDQELATANEESCKPASIGQILSQSDTVECLLLLGGVLWAILSGFSWPIFNVIFGSVVDVFVHFEQQQQNSSNNATINSESAGELMHKIYFWAGLTVATGVYHLVANFTTLYCLQMFGLRRIRSIKRRYFAAVLKQEIAWFDRQSSGEFASHISSDFKKFESGINENLSILINHITGALVCLGIGLYFGWKLSLAIASLAPLLAGSAIICAKLQAKYSSREMEANSEASSVAEETISAIRTVFAFAGQTKERARYENKVSAVMKTGFKRNLVSAIDNSVTWLAVYTGLAIGVWYGVSLFLDASEQYSVGSVVIIYWSISFAGYNVGNAAPYWESFKIARSSAGAIFAIIQRASAIDSASKAGKQLDGKYRANIELRNVHFSYPTRSEVEVLQGIDLSVESGEIVALVGASGCGKSTIIQLIQRLYDPSKGEVLLDGVDIKKLNVGWLRQQIGVVGQEPVLFGTSIEDNIQLGAIAHSVTKDAIEQAAKEANAHEFIEKLQEGYATLVGDRGAQLSGGQKQRIAIARALVRAPKILLLDEATSALDLRSEQIVQAALDRASQGRTTIIVAHRLSTIINANRIVLLDAGRVLEQGTHKELMDRRSAYYNLVEAQQVATDSATNTLTSVDQEGEMLDNDLDLREDKVQIDAQGGDDESETEEEQQKARSMHAPYSRLFNLVWLDKWPFLVALLASILYGTHTPIYALIFGGFVDTFTESANTHPDYLRAQSVKFALLFGGEAVAVFVCNLLQIALFGLVGERLTRRLRGMAFSAIIDQEVAWFDEPQNSTGALCSRLGDDAASVQGLTGLRISVLCQATVALIASLIIGFVFNWRMALVSLALMPLVALGAVLGQNLYSAQAAQDGQTSRAAGKVIIEVVNAMRTVVSLHKEAHFADQFGQYLHNHYRIVKPKVLWKSVLVGVSLAVPFFAYAIAYIYGAYLLSNQLLKSGDFFRIVECMIYGAVIVGETTVVSADYHKAKMAAFNIFKLIDRKPAKRPESVSARTLSSCEGNVTFKDLHFEYPSRPDTSVLKGLSFCAHKGETVALVGASGCGKSTALQLLEQFYEPNGEIQLDGTDIRTLNTDWARSQMALVAQEPVLFGYSIRENILYGDNSHSVPFDQIVQAAQLANAHEFIKNLPLGYETPVGSKGGQLSGGQKQRIAIARALVRNPPILLLDEATSALDTASEKVVQEALDKASKGRTCIVIAHRLKTIVGADKIVVIDKGRNVEEGSHQELLARKGYYWQLYNRAVGL